MPTIRTSVLGPRRQQTWFVCILALVFALIPATAGNRLWAAPKQVADAPPGDCKACHGEENVLPPSHADTSAMRMQDCLACHDDESGLAGQIPGSHLHMLRGTGCKECHGKQQSYGAMTTDDCLVCHGSRQAVAALTAGKDPDFHNSPHYGPDLDCDLCHRMHSKSQNYCNYCHEFKATVP